METKQCKNCFKIKSLEEFTTGQGKFKKSNTCKVCCNSIAKKHREVNLNSCLQKERIRSRRYKATHPRVNCINAMRSQGFELNLYNKKVIATTRLFKLVSKGIINKEIAAKLFQEFNNDPDKTLDNIFRFKLVGGGERKLNGYGLMRSKTSGNQISEFDLIKSIINQFHREKQLLKGVS